MEKVKKLYVALVVLFLYAPIGVLVAQSFNASRYRGHWTGFTLQWYGELFQNEGILDALQNTVTIGLSSAAIATVLGLITCMALRGMGRKPRSVFLGVASMPLLNADIVTGISLMLLFLGMGLRLGYGSILMAHVVFNLPYVILCIMPQFLSLDRSCYDAADENLCRTEIGHPSGNVRPFDVSLRLRPGLRRLAHRQPQAPDPGTELVGGLS